MFIETEFKMNFGCCQFNFTASPVQIYMFVLTMFVAFISPFGGFLIAGLKRALRSKQRHRLHGGVIDRLDCILVVGFFMLMFVPRIVYNEKSYVQVASMVEALNPTARKMLLSKLQAHFNKSIL